MNKIILLLATVLVAYGTTTAMAQDNASEADTWEQDSGEIDSMGDDLDEQAEKPKVEEKKPAKAVAKEKAKAKKAQNKPAKAKAKDKAKASKVSKKKAHAKSKKTTNKKDNSKKM